MKTYTMTYELTTHHRHEAKANSLEEAQLIFEANQSVCVDTQETSYATEIEEM